MKRIHLYECLFVIDRQLQKIKNKISDKNGMSFDKIPTNKLKNKIIIVLD